VEVVARDSLRDGFSVCIDRTNIDQSQRAHWIRIAREFPNTPVWIIVFDTPYDVCASRLQQRISHPTISSVEQGLSILAKFALQYRPPTADEGFERIIWLKPSDTKRDHSVLDVSMILERVRSSAVVSHSAPVRTSWAERRHTSGRGFQTRVDEKHSARSRSSLFGTPWERRTGAIVQTQSSDTGQRLPVSAVESGDIDEAGADYDTQNSPPLGEARYLSDSLGVD